MKRIIILLLTVSNFSFSQNLNEQIIAIEDKLISWRHDIHKNPELSNREFRTSKVIANHLKSLNIKVIENVAKTGVVGILNGNKPGKVVALRADMDALPIHERNDLEYKSINDGVMHACGHDTHMAILMATAEILSKNRDFPGTVKFIFQPAEEGPPAGEEGGARLMIKEGVLKNPDVDAIFGLHISSLLPMNRVYYKPRGFFASSSSFTIKIKGEGTHGGTPWFGVDPIVISAEIISALQTIISRQSNLTEEAAVLSIGQINGGNRFNIIPEEVTMVGTIRALNYEMRDKIKEKMHGLVDGISKSFGAKSEVEIIDGADITYNDPDMMNKMLPSLKRSAGDNNVILTKAKTVAEDYAYYLNNVPGFLFELGGYNPDLNKPTTPHHTADFTVDDKSMLLGVKAMTNLALDFLRSE
ncbi:MAG: amidohydrolase [Bacteroidota bacterium]|nr:amidohydrolase [Bacteroidota bacterium]